MAEYGAQVSELTRSKPGRAELGEARDALGGRLRGLLDRANSTAMDSLSREDLVAIVHVAEAARSFEDVIRFGECALERDPSREEVYFPVVRALLNIRQPERAEAVLAQGIEKVQGTSRLPALHGLLYYYYAGQAQPEASGVHLEQFVTFLFERLESDRDAPLILVGHLAKYVELHPQHDSPAEAIARLEEQLRRTEQLCTTCPDSTVARGYWRLRCELTKVVAPEHNRQIAGAYMKAIGDWTESGADQTIVSAELRWVGSFLGRAIASEMLSQQP